MKENLGILKDLTKKTERKAEHEVANPNKEMLDEIENAKKDVEEVKKERDSYRHSYELLLQDKRRKGRKLIG